MSEDPAQPTRDHDAYEYDSDDYEYSSADVVDAEQTGDRRRGRRPVADWGGDDLFTHVPRRRFTRAVPATHSRRPGAVPVGTHQSRRSGESPSISSLGADHGGYFNAEESAPASGHSLDRASVVVHDEHSVGIEPRGRRPERRRRAVDERGLPRPDRVAAWAFMLGMLLVLLAVATADAALLTI